MRGSHTRLDLWTLGLSAAVVGLLSSCGGAEKSQSARFVETTTYYSPDEVPAEQRIVGSFDWGVRSGRATDKGFGETEQTIQVGDQCYSRIGAGSWKNTTADDIDGLCDAALFSSPYDLFTLMGQVASGFRRVGQERVRGVTATHHHGRLDIGGVKGSIEVWVDDEEVVRKMRQANGDTTDGFATIREYYDFGVDVDVNAPPPFGRGGG
jgi:hypothetical protein